MKSLINFGRSSHRLHGLNSLVLAAAAAASILQGHTERGDRTTISGTEPLFSVTDANTTVDAHPLYLSGEGDTSTGGLG